jgi:preprotein translocase subunit YajC
MNGLASLIIYSGATTAQANPQGQPNMFGMFLPLILIVLVMYFLMIRPQQKRQKQHTAMINALKTGDEIVTTGGVYGTVAGVDDRKSVIYVKIASDIKIKVDRAAVSRVVTETPEPIK